MFELCCCDTEDQVTETIGPLSSTDENSFARGVPPRAVPATSSGSPPLMPGQRETEKARLEALASRFAKQAVKGLHCTYWREGTGEWVRTQYRITKGLEKLMVMSPLDASQAEVTCPLAVIQDIYTFIEDGQAVFQGDLLNKVDAAGLNKDLLLMIVYGDGVQRSFRFCLLMDDRESRDTFLECLRILCIYALNRHT
mmetsp:Transcript_137927/g.384651  ORF Transcript_137927/g.384651 Transcript_137927/m.384651 type:complete len:197 (+) Transcript_137927:79-669(+)